MHLRGKRFNNSQLEEEIFDYLNELRDKKVFVNMLFSLIGRYKQVIEVEGGYVFSKKKNIH